MYSLIDYKNHLTVAKAENFTEWMYSEIKPYLKGNILEIGSGLGTYSRKVARDFKKSSLWFSDVDLKNIVKLKKTFQNFSNVSVTKLDLNDPDDYAKISGRVDTVLALNVLEHLKDDGSVLNNIYNLLAKNGNLIILIPAHKFLFNCIDASTGHLRRYEKKEILKKIALSRFKIKKIFYFNFLSVFSWYINGTILKKPLISEHAMRFYDKMVPLVRFIEKRVLRQKFGISMIIVLGKN